MITIEKLEINQSYKNILSRYQTYLLTKKYLSDNSINSYILDIYKYLSFLDNFNIKIVKDIKKEDIYNYL